MIMLCQECDRPLPVPNVRTRADVACPSCGARYEVTVKLVQGSPLDAKVLAERRNRNS